ncbi:MAG: hypothetical protein JO269_11525 [Burkholderiaceae bacterium]|nr:hypothetical protein [Burkholderiaceae bacterium]
MIVALSQIAFSTFPQMAARGRWGQFVLFRQSALASHEVLDELTQLMQKLHQANIAPNASAFIFEPTVEAAFMMGPLFESCYRHSGLTFRFFTDAVSGRTWLAQQLSTGD